MQDHYYSSITWVHSVRVVKAVDDSLCYCWMRHSSNLLLRALFEAIRLRWRTKITKTSSSVHSYYLSLYFELRDLWLNSVFVARFIVTRFMGGLRDLWEFARFMGGFTRFMGVCEIYGSYEIYGAYRGETVREDVSSNNEFTYLLQCSSTVFANSWLKIDGPVRNARSRTVILPIYCDTESNYFEAPTLYLECD